MALPAEQFPPHTIETERAPIGRSFFDLPSFPAAPNERLPIDFNAQVTNSLSFYWRDVRRTLQPWKKLPTTLRENCMEQFSGALKDFEESLRESIKSGIVLTLHRTITTDRRLRGLIDKYQSDVDEESGEVELTFPSKMITGCRALPYFIGTSEAEPAMWLRAEVEKDGVEEGLEERWFRVPLTNVMVANIEYPQGSRPDVS